MENGEILKTNEKTVSHTRLDIIYAECGLLLDLILSMLSVVSQYMYEPKDNTKRGRVQN